MSPPDSPSPAAAETEVFLTPATAKAKKPREAEEEEEEEEDGRGAARMDEAVARAASNLGGDGDDAADLDGLADDDDAFYPDADAILTEAQRQATEMADQASAALSEGVDALSGMFGWSSASTTTTTTTTAETTARSTTSRPTDAETTTSSRDGVDDPFGIAQGISELWKGIDYLVADATGEGGDGEDAMTTTRGGGSGGGGGVWDGYAVVRRPRAKPPSTTPAQLREKFPALPSGSTLLECFACDVEQRYALATEGQLLEARSSPAHCISCGCTPAQVSMQARQLVGCGGALPAAASHATKQHLPPVSDSARREPPSPLQHSKTTLASLETGRETAVASPRAPSSPLWSFLP